MAIDPKKIKKDFPIFKNNPGLVYLDSGATSQKPQTVINAVKNYFEKYNAPIHRGLYELAEKSTEMYEEARAKVAKFIGAKSDEIVFTGNASEAINLAAYGWARKFLKKGDVIVLTEMEHHSNIVPWIQIHEMLGVELFYLPFDKNFRLDYKSLFKPVIASPDKIGAKQSQKKDRHGHSVLAMTKNVDLKKIKLVTLTQASNVLGTINPVKEIISYYKKQGIKAKFLVDGAQSIPHFKINVKDLDCDFFAFSSHKMLGPSGVGVLYAKKEVLDQMDPLFFGGQMIKIVNKESATWADGVAKFEVGTGKKEGVIGLGAAIDYLEKIGMDNIFKYEHALTEYGLKVFKKYEKYVDLYGSKNAKDRLAVFSFNFKDIHGHDTAEILNRKKVCVRSGHHCAQILMKCLNQIATARASAYLYNTKEDFDKLAEGFDEVIKVFKL